jgi:hypothetical protein
MLAAEINRDWQTVLDSGITYNISSWANYVERPSVGAEYAAPDMDVSFGPQISNAHHIDWGLNARVDHVGVLESQDTQALAVKTTMGRALGVDQPLSGSAPEVLQKAGGMLGFNGMPLMSEGLVNPSVERDGVRVQFNDAEGTWESVPPSTEGGAALKTPHTYTISDRFGGVLLPAADSTTLVNLGFDDKGAFNFSPVAQIGNLTYSNVKVAQTVTAADGVVTKTADTAWSDKTLAIPWSLSFGLPSFKASDGPSTTFEIYGPEDAVANLSFIGGVDSGNFGFDAKNNFVGNVGQLTVQRALDPSASVKREETVDGDTLFTFMPTLPTYREWGAGEWKVPEGRVFFGSALKPVLLQLVGGKDLSVNPIVAQDTRLTFKRADGVVYKEDAVSDGSAGLHYLIEDLSFVEPGKLKTDTSSLDSSKTASQIPVLGYDLDHTDKTFGLAGKGIITADNVLMPVRAALSGGGKLEYNPLTLAENLSYDYG